MKKYCLNTKVAAFAVHVKNLKLQQRWGWPGCLPLSVLNQHHHCQFPSWGLWLCLALFEMLPGPTQPSWCHHGNARVCFHLEFTFEVYTNLDSIFKSRDIILPTKVCLVKAMVFPVVMHGCESWTVKKAEPQRIDAFELWCLRRLLRVPWTARRSNQSILKERSVLGVHWKEWC